MDNNKTDRATDILRNIRRSCKLIDSPYQFRNNKKARAKIIKQVDVSREDLQTLYESMSASELDYMNKMF